MKKKGIVLALVAAFCMAALTGCGGGSDSGEKLYLYNWTEYIPQEVYDAFEEETGIEVIESTFSSNEEMLAKLTAGGTGQYDMVVASNYVIKAMEEQGLIQELDKTQLENLGNISDAALGMNFDPENQYSIPFMGGITVIAYNTKMCEELGVTIEKFDDLLNPALENNMVVVDDVREIVGIALKAQGQDSNTTDQAVIEGTLPWLQQLVPNIKAYDSDSPKTLLASNEVAVGVVYNTMKFIDFVHRPDIYKMILDEFPGVCVNDAALEIMDERYLENPGSNVDQSEIARANLIEEVGDAVTYYDDVFTKMKTN